MTLFGMLLCLRSCRSVTISVHPSASRSIPIKAAIALLFSVIMLLRYWRELQELRMHVGTLGFNSKKRKNVCLDNTVRFWFRDVRSCGKNCLRGHAVARTGYWSVSYSRTTSKSRQRSLTEAFVKTGDMRMLKYTWSQSCKWVYEYKWIKS